MTLSINLVAAISLAAYFIIIVLDWGRPLRQQIAFLAVFLAGTSVIGELDVLLSIYFVVSFIVLFPHIKKLSGFTLLLFFYIIPYVMIGVFRQNPERTMVMLIAKIWQFVVFFLLIDQPLELRENIDKRLFIRAMIVETVLGIYLMINSTMTDTLSGLVRLVTNGQPISGNLSTVLLPVSAYYYMQNRNDPSKIRFLLWTNLYFLIWIVLSGTRGYTLEYVAVMGFVFFDFFTSGKSGRTAQINRFFVLLSLGVGAVALVAVIPGLLERLSNILRLTSTVGIRTYENAAVREYLQNTDLTHLFFGIGYGGTAASDPAMLRALYRQFSLGMWNQNTYLYRSGPTFHSLYANIAVGLGIIGILFLFASFVRMWKKVSRICEHDSFIRGAMHLFLISFFVMNYYRWSADCGITEMIIFAMVLKMIEKEKKADAPVPHADARL